MAFTYQNSRERKYILHSREVTLKGGTVRPFYFFASTEREGALDAVPAGMEVVESKNGLPVLKKLQTVKRILEVA